MGFDEELTETARYVLAAFRKAGIRIATAESCTGGMVSAVLTAIGGSSDVFERGFVTYSNEAKQELLGVPGEMITQFGAVSAEVAIAMAQGALAHSSAEVSVAITGVAGPAGGSEEKPVGLVYVSVAAADGAYVEELRLGDTVSDLDGEAARQAIRRFTTLAALEMLAAFGLDGPDDDEPDTPIDPIGRLN